jgi:hypothetical protein
VFALALALSLLELAPEAGRGPPQSRDLLPVAEALSPPVVLRGCFVSIGAEVP